MIVLRCVVCARASVVGATRAYTINSFNQFSHRFDATNIVLLARIINHHSVRHSLHELTSCESQRSLDANFVARSMVVGHPQVQSIMATKNLYQW